MEIVAHHQMDCAMVPDKVVGDKFPPGSRHHGPVIVGDDDPLDAIEPVHKGAPVGGGGEQGHRLLAGDQGGGVKVKGKGGGNDAQLLGPLGTEGEKDPVAHMHSIEEPQRHDTFFLLHRLIPRKSF